MPSGYENPDLNATKVPTDVDVAWAAGIYEGEGHIHERRIASAQVGVTQKDPEILYRLRDWFGGSVKFRYCATVPFENLCYNWAICGDKCRLFTARIYPFLSSRRKSQIEATKTLDFLGGSSPEGMKLQEIVEKLKIFSESRFSTDPVKIARREKAKLAPWYVKRRQLSKNKVLTQERVM